MIEMEREEQTPANVIKRPPGTTGLRGVVKNQTIAALREAEEIVARARAEGDEIRREALEEAERVREAAYREGFEKALAEFTEHLINIKEIRVNALMDAERDLLRLSVRIAEKILGRELDADKGAIGDIVKAALHNARQQEKISVLVNPSDLEAAAEAYERFSKEGRNRNIDFVADPSVDAGGCVIETEVGRIDAGLETQLKVIESALLKQAEAEEHA